MLSTRCALALLLFISQITTVTCKAFIHSPHGLHSRFREREVSLRRTAIDTIESLLSDRDEEPVQTVERRQTLGGGGSNSSEINSAINSACTGAISAIQDFNSDSGLGGCYNIMYLNRTNGLFQADLRLYKVSEPRGAFSGISIDNMLVNLNSDFAQFAQVSLTPSSKRSFVDERQNSDNYEEVLEGLWEGQIEQLDYSKLSTSDFMALMIPEFDIRAIQPDTQTPVNSQLNTSSAVYFVTGGIVASEQQAVTATKPGSAAAAAEKASVFVLPGTTLGIFPIGLIVTGSWAVLFIFTFGLGTIGRIRYRSLYRSRLVALGRLRSL
jgi:hypothetical protein